MGGSIRLGKFRGISIEINYTWFIIFFFLIISLALYYFPWRYEHWSASTCWSAGIITSLLFFASVLAHELAHSIVAIRNGIPVKSITLFIFGGMARIAKEPSRPSVELKIALAGPLCSLGLAGFFAAIWRLSLGTIEPVAAVTAYLAIINGMLAVFNMIPGFPLDGGRVFRSLVWHLTGSYRRATRIAYLSGRGIAYLFVVGGVVLIFTLSAWFDGLWLIFIGWVLHSAATSSYRQMKLRLALEPLTAEELMIRDCPSVPRGLSLRELVDDYFISSERRYFLVAEEGKLEGIITLADVRKVPKERWELTTVAQAMTPAERLTTVSPSDNGAIVLERMDEGGVEHMPVVGEGKVMGIISRDRLWQFAQLHTDYR
jgi:Zn-dependent protease